MIDNALIVEITKLNSLYDNKLLNQLTTFYHTEMPCDTSVISYNSSVSLILEDTTLNTAHFPI